MKNYSPDELHCFVRDSFSLVPTGKGILNGLTFVVKDNIALKNHISSFGHEAWRNTHNKSTENAPTISKLLSAGAKMVGVAKLDQLTYSLTGNVSEGTPPINPLYPDRFTGGSSSGSASAVAGNVADIGIGTDTGGSVRVPAALCGLFGFRPTHGTINTKGVIPLAPRFDTVGIFARNSSLLLTVYSAIAEKTESRQEKITTVILPLESLSLVSTEIAHAVRSGAYQLAQTLNTNVEEISGSELYNSRVRELLVRLQTREIWEIHGTWIKAHNHSLSPEVSKRLEMCEKNANAPQEEKDADEQEFKNYRKTFNSIVTPGTVMAVPVTSDFAMRRNAIDEALKISRTANLHLNAIAGLAGAPEVVTPVVSELKNSVGVGFIGAINQDEAILEAVSMFK